MRINWISQSSPMALVHYVAPFLPPSEAKVKKPFKVPKEKHPIFNPLWETGMNGINISKCRLQFGECVYHKSIDTCIVSQKVIMVQLIRSTHFISIEMREEKKE